MLDFGDKHFVSSISQLGWFYIVEYSKELLVLLVDFTKKDTFRVVFAE